MTAVSAGTKESYGRRQCSMSSPYGATLDRMPLHSSIAHYGWEMTPDPRPPPSFHRVRSTQRLLRLLSLSSAPPLLLCLCSRPPQHQLLPPPPPGAPPPPPEVVSPDGLGSRVSGLGSKVSGLGFWV
eukprot:2116432-Rhodomonas_salina.2